MKLKLMPYFFRQALTNIRTNKATHFIGLGTMVVSMLIFSAFLLLYVNINTWLQNWKHPLTMTVYLHDVINKAAREKLTSDIASLPNTTIERFISKDAALKELRSSLGSQAGLLDGLSTNPLPASLEVLVTYSKGEKPNIRTIKRKIEKLKGVDEVQCSEEAFERFEGLMNIIGLVGFIIGGLLSIGVIFIVTNAVKLAIYSRKEEIEISKLVGATDWFIRMPFLLEGAIQGIMGGGLTLLLLYFGYLLLSTEELNFLNLAMLKFVFLPFEYATSIFLLNLILGLVGSFIAIGQFFDIQ
jgi:cell division transport system permease protein